MSRLDEFETRVETHWRVVGVSGIAYRTNAGIEDAEKWLKRFTQTGHDGPYHIEVWREEYDVSPSKWTRVE